MKNIVNGKKVTNEEIKTIESAVNTIGGGELYSFFKISNYSNEAEITKAYNEFKRINNNDTTAMDSCYKVLSDSRLRSIYDSLYFNDLIKQNNQHQHQHQQSQHQQNQPGNQIEENNNKLLLLKTLSIPLYTLSTILNANSGIINNNNNNQINLLNGGIINYLIKSHKELIELIFKKSGIIGFYRGSIFKVISYPFQKLFVNIPSSILLNQFFYKNSFIKPLIYKTISEFPSTLLSDYMILSFSKPLITQIKNLFGNSSSGVIDSISIKNLFYSIGSSIILLSTRRLILNLIKKVEIKLIQSKIENPNSKLIKYSQIIYCNPVIQCLFTTLLINPLEVLRLQSMVSYLNNYSNNLKILSPIQMVIDLIKNKNSNLFGYLFNGAPTLYLYLLISNLKKLNNNNNNNNNNNDNIHSLI
ncbi:hypothetical protein ACTFIR_002487 [Dictyostelium discoideum]